MNNNRLALSYANPIQESFIWNTFTESCFDGGVGNGKTTGGLFRLLFLAHEFPGSRWVVARKYWVDLERTTQKTFFEKVCPREWYDPKRGGRNVLGFTRLVNGSEILWLHLDTMDERSLMSLEINGSFIDQAEEIDASMYEMLESRAGRWSKPEWKTPCPRYTWIASNPNGHDWIYYRFHPDCNPPVYRGYYFGTTLDNLETLRKVNPDYVENLLKKSETWKSRWVYGNREIFEGQIHRGFSRRIHVYDHKKFDPFKQRPVTLLTAYFDYGLSSPTASLVVAKDKEKYIWILGEYYCANRKISEHATELKKFWGGYDRRAEWVKADPSVFFEEMRDREGPVSIAKEYAQHGVYLIKADNNEDTSIERINELLAIDDSRFHPITRGRGSPLLFISDTCTNLVEELPNQRWKQKRNVLTGETEFVEERDPNLPDHAYDCLRYMANDSLDYKPFTGEMKRLGTTYGARV